MRTRAESLLLWGAWIAIAGAGALGARTISRIPKVDPGILREEARLKAEALRKVPPLPADRSWERFQAQQRWLAEARPSPAGDWAMYLWPKLVARRGPRVRVPVSVLPGLLEASAGADLDGAALSWKIGPAPVPLAEWEDARAAAPTGFRIWRREAGAEWEPVAELNAKATSWSDVGAPSDRSLEYRVELKGPEGARSASWEVEASARTPSDLRVKLVGGDAGVAILKLETYKRGERKWSAARVQVRPGGELWPGGWRLTGLRFDRFTLLADVELPDGGSRTLSTKD
jgi:hypothetical protein